jgi:phosphotransferase system enzyme I (PtsI)
MSIFLTGVGASRGIVIGKAHVVLRDQVDIPEYLIQKQYIDDEVDRLQKAIKAARAQLKAVRKHIPGDAPADVTSFIDTHLLMLEDSMLSDEPVNLIRSKQYNAEWALKVQRDAIVRVFEEMDDPYLRTRMDDVDHVVNRVQHLLLDKSEQSQMELGSRLEGYVLIAEDLTPADAVLMQHYGIAGFITEYGGPTSHTAILARSLGIPAIVGLRHALRYIQNDEPIAMDGEAGTVIADIDEVVERQYRRLQREEKKRQSELRKLKGKPAITLDGTPISLHANIELPEDISAVRRVGADGIGLYRTEFLFMNRDDTPDETEQFRAYTKVLNALKGAPVTIRTLDLGADKQVDAGPASKPASYNPALGLRAVRLCLRDPELFMPQLRAILRASAKGPARIMIPMLSNLTELNQVMTLIEEAKRQLTAEGKKFNPDIPVGGMIEVPAAALMAGQFARQLDFLSIGTNDLIQYTLAIDRIDDEVSYLYDPLHPAVLQLIHNTIRAGEKAGIPVSMCGEMAGDPRFTRLLLGLGLREFSMHPSALFEVKHLVNTSKLDVLEKHARKALRGGRQSDIEKIIDQLNKLTP